MNRSDLRLAIAVVLAGIGALMASFGAVSNPVFFGLALPFLAASYLIWLDATGRLIGRSRSRRSRRRHGARETVDGARRRRRGREHGSSESTGSADRVDRKEARRVLGIDSEADDATIRRAYRERVKETHPDVDSGSEEAFKRVTDAYERLEGKQA